MDPEPTVELALDITVAGTGGAPSIFQLEIHAILSCVQRIIELGAFGRRISICSGNQAALRALMAQKTTSRLVWDCKVILNQLANNNKVRLLWVLGDTRIRGNEIADRLAALGARTPQIGPEPFTGAANCLLGGAIREWVMDKHTRE